MALPNIVLKRYNGSTYDELYPKTSIEQVVNLQTALDNKVDDTEKGAVNGVATLDSNQTLTTSQIPAWLLAGGQRQVGTWGTATSTMDSFMQYIFDNNNGSSPYVSLYGSYFIATVATTLSWSNPYALMGNVVVNPGDEGDTTSPISLEAGDLLVFVKYTDTTTDEFQFAVINNTYGLATTTAPGIVTLSSSTSTATGGTNVVTDEVILNLIGTGTGKIAAGNHIHSEYQPIDTDLTAIAGLAKTDGNIIVGNGTTWVAENGATARTSLGLTIGTDVQAYDAGLASIAGLTTAANKMIYTTALDTYSTTDLTVFARSLLDDADAPTARQTLGVEIGVNVQAWDGDLDTISALSKTDGNFIVANGTSWTVESGSTARTSLGVYSTSEIDTKLTNRPEILYDSLTATVTGTLVIDII